MTSPTVPDWDDIPEDDQAEPDDADVQHLVPPDEIDETES